MWEGNVDVLDEGKGQRRRKRRRDRSWTRVRWKKDYCEKREEGG